MMKLFNRLINNAFIFLDRYDKVIELKPYYYKG